MKMWLARDPNDNTENGVSLWLEKFEPFLSFDNAYKQYASNGDDNTGLIADYGVTIIKPNQLIGNGFKGVKAGMKKLIEV